jgi:uncharacterized protein
MAVHRLNGVDKADTIWSRFIGLMGQRNLENVRLWFPRCASIHTCFMRASIDIVFLDEVNVVVSLHPDVRPWRIVNERRAASVLELAVGGIRDLTLRVGDEVLWECA